MFSGIVEGMGTVVAIDKEQENVHLTLECDFVSELKIDQSAAKKIITSTNIIKAKIKDACAQVFLLGCVPSPKAQTNNIINPTKGIA